EFAIKYLEAHSANVQASTIHTLRERLGLPTDRQQSDARAARDGNLTSPTRKSRRKHKTAIEAFGELTLRELEHASADIADWNAATSPATTASSSSNAPTPNAAASSPTAKQHAPADPSHSATAPSPHSTITPPHTSPPGSSSPLPAEAAAKDAAATATSTSPT